MRKLLLLAALWCSTVALAHAATYRAYYGFEIVSISGGNTTIRVWVGSDPTSLENLAGQILWTNSGNQGNSNWIIASSGSSSAYPAANYYINFTFPSTAVDINLTLVNCDSGSTTNNCYGYDEFFISSGPLPVELIRFSALKEDNNVLLQWTTASEHNNAGFELERSADAVHWTNVTWIPTKNGNTDRVQQYAFLDEHPIRGLNYYRLRQTDRDGKVVLYPVTVVNMGGRDYFYLTGNVVQNSEANLFMSETSSGVATLRLISATGQLVRSWQVEAESEQILPIDVSGLTPGIWFLQVNQSAAMRLLVTE